MMMKANKKYIWNLWCIYLAGVVILLHMIVPHHHHYYGVSEFHNHTANDASILNLNPNVERVSNECNHFNTSENQSCLALEQVFFEDIRNKVTALFPFVLYALVFILLVLRFPLLGDTSKRQFYFCLKYNLFDSIISSCESRRGPPHLII
ncbi:hypothetical protein K5X82_03850 [Halosquirtibacter xylanolyticus]|uniref:hypothetical protein n=1 Tax=Halosquirtibacter xylanolyticus TaxID=3374599 RepID=UPI0037492187|nr:hypothetical protein K5X82_03850 [Prolixibacteraceae bacterium]